MADNEFANLVKCKIRPGKYWGGYKQICGLLDEPVYKDKIQKKKQIKYWARFFEYEIIKNSRTWEVKNIYEIPKPLTIQGSGNNMTSLAADILAKIIVDDKKNKHLISWVGTNSSIAKDIGITSEDYYRAKKNLKDTVEEVKNFVTPVDKNITYADVSHYFAQTDDRVKYIVEKALDELEKQHVIMYEKKYVIYDIEKKSFHSVNMDNSEDRERIVFYNTICIDFMREHNIEKDDLHTLKANLIDPKSYYRELNEITSSQGFTIFKAYVIITTESILTKFYEDKMLNENDLDDMRFELYTQFNKKGNDNQKRYTDKKSRSVDIGRNPDEYVSKNYLLVCDYLTKRFKEFKKYNAIHHTLGFQQMSKSNIEMDGTSMVIDIIDGIVPIIINRID